jgi:Ca2+-binding EF-hand superfamily protein
LAGDKGYVSTADLAEIMKEIPIRHQICQLVVAKNPLSGNADEVDFEMMLQTIVWMRDRNSKIEYHTLFRMYDRGGKRVISKDDFVYLLS